MLREEMIQLLVQDRLEHRGDFRKYMWLQQVLENGFRGYAQLSDRELSAEVQIRGLLHDDVPDDTQSSEDDAEIASLLHTGVAGAAAAE